MIHDPSCWMLPCTQLHDHDKLSHSEAPDTRTVLLITRGVKLFRKVSGPVKERITSPHFAKIGHLIPVIKLALRLFHTAPSPLSPDSLPIPMLTRITPSYLKRTLRLITNPATRHSNLTATHYSFHSTTSRSHTMSTSTPSPPKRIFAPTSNSSDPGHATQYTKGALNITDVLPSPTDQFHAWFQEATSQNVYQPETVTFSTASLPSGRVSARVVYMKELDAKGFVIYSNWDTSRKARDVASNPHASLTFYWREMERQVRVEGRVERLSGAESQVYYDTRIRGSRLGAWASRQSEVLGSREELEVRS